jgi:hypothetical protein
MPHRRSTRWWPRQHRDGAADHRVAQRDPLQMAVITVGAFQAGEANNVIPPTAS